MSGLSASPDRDARLRKAAEMIAGYVRSLIPEMVRDAGAVRALIQNARTSVLLPLPDSIAETAEIEPFVFTLMFYVAKDRTVAYYVPERDILAVGLLPQDVSAAMFLPSRRRSVERYMLDMLQKQQGVVVHEATHMLDTHRAPGLQRRPRSMKEELNISFSKYVNSPHEFNAFFQEMVSETQATLNHATEQELREILSSFDTFLEVVEETPAYLNIREHLNKKYRRRLHTRLWQAWNSLRDQAEQDERRFS